MADAKIIITADTSQAQRALGDLQRSLSQVESAATKGGGGGGGIGGALASTFKVGAAAAAALGVAVGALAVKAVGTAIEMENLRIRLDALGGSSEAGAKSLEVITAAAQKLPFSLKEIANASTSLITVSKDTNDLGKNIQLTADIAAASGLSFQDTAQQIQRAFSSGAASADMFRERGILASAGFQAGVTYSIDETRKKFEQFGKTIEGVSNRLNDTLTGALSQLGDQFDKLQAAFGKPISTALGAAINMLVDDINKASESTTNLATTLGQKAALAIADFIDFIALMADAVYGVYQTYKPLLDILLKLSLMLGDVIVRAVGLAIYAFSKLTTVVGALTDALGLTDGAADKLSRLGDIGLDLAKKGLPGLKDAAKDALGAMAGGADGARTSLGKYSQAIRDSIAQQIKAANSAKNLPANVTLPLGNKGYEQDAITKKYILDLDLAIVNAGIMDNTERAVGVKLAEYRSKVTQEIYDKEKGTVEQLLLQLYSADKLRELKVAQNSAQESYNALSIKNLNLREEELAVANKRNEVGKAFNSDMEEAVRKTVRLGQATKDALSGFAVFNRVNPVVAMQSQYASEQQQLKAALDAKMVSEQEYQDSLLALKKEYSDKSNQLYISQIENEKSQRTTQIQAEQMRLGKTAEQARTYAEFEMKTTAEKTQFALEQGANIFNALGAQNKKAFEAAKAFNIANAIMNTYMSVTKALASYPFPFSLIAAGGALAFGMAQVGQIRSQQYSGRALGGPVMGNQSYIVGENGPEMFTPATSGKITRNDQLGGGATTNINFTIVANDTEGFDQLLTSRKGVIQQIISDAMLERGQRM